MPDEKPLTAKIAEKCRQGREETESGNESATCSEKLDRSHFRLHHFRMHHLRLRRGQLVFLRLLLAQLRKLYPIHIARQAKGLQPPDSVPVQVNFVPLQSVAGRNRVGVMIIVPSLAKRKQRHPPVVRRKIAIAKTLRSPTV